MTTKNLSLVIRIGNDYGIDYLPHTSGFATEESIDAMREAAKGTGYTYVSLRYILSTRKALLEIAKEYHGWDDPLHTQAMPNCPKCEAINKVLNEVTNV